MRVLMISDVYFPRVNGVSTSIRTFRRELQALGHHVTLIAPDYPGVSGVSGVDDANDADIVRIPSRKVPRDPEDRMMRRGHIDRSIPMLKRRQFDVVHIHTPFVAHYAGLSLARQLSLPVVESYHTFFEEYLYHYIPLIPKPAMRFFARRFTVSQCNAVDRIVAPSRAMQTALHDYGVRTAIDVLPTGLDAAQFRLGDGARFRAKYGIGEQPCLLYVGRVAYEKNIDFLLHTFKQVLASVPTALLLIVGEGPAEAHLHRLAKTLQIETAVRFIGYLDRDTELLDCYRAGDLFVFASRTETQGLVLLEALAQGTPVVSTVHMGTRDVLEHARGACVVDENVSTFADAAIGLLRDNEARSRLSMLAPSDATKWSSREMAERLLRFYGAVIGAKQSGISPALQSAATDSSRAPL